MDADFPFQFLGPPFRWLALAILFALVAAIVGVLIYLAGLPGKIAAGRGHPQASAVNVCGWLGLPTGVLWVLALAWSYYRPVTGRPVTGRPDDANEVEMEGLTGGLSRLENAVSLLERTRGASR